MCEDAFGFYRQKIAENPDILPYFEQATPVLEFELAKIGSRPSRRSQSRNLEELRAIPWGFGWIQSRLLVPAWFGVGTAFENFAARGGAEARDAADDDAPLPLLFRHGAQRRDGPCKGRPPPGPALFRTGRAMSALRERVFPMLVDEFRRTRRMVLEVTGQERLLETDPDLARSLRLRNPYVDPMSLIQIELLRRKRSGRETEELNYVLAATINGIAAGLRNTG